MSSREKVLRKKVKQDIGVKMMALSFAASVLFFTDLSTLRSSRSTIDYPLQAR